jgi:hypothetical protein
MHISNTLLNEYIKSWNTGIDWTAKDITKVAALLKQIALLNGGIIKYDIELDEEIRENYLLSIINEGLNAVVRSYHKKLKLREDDGYFWKERNDIETKFDFTRPVRYFDKTAINLASVQELLTIPLISENMAVGIVDFREQNGYFTDIKQLLKIEGVNEADVKSLGYALSVFNPDDSLNYPATVKTFGADPDFRNYINILKNGDQYVFENEVPQPINPDLYDILIKELRKIVRYLKKHHYPKYGKYRRVRASRIQEDYEHHEFVKELEDNASGDFRGAAVLDDTQYLYFLLRALKTAQKKIRIIMFFMAFKDEERYPTDKIMDEILKAKQRGVDVKIILDKDAEGDVYGSRIINYDAFKKFTENGIDVLFDFEEKVTHSKIVIIDDEHVIVGSHNWTAGSFYAYDDKASTLNQKTLIKR